MGSFLTKITELFSSFGNDKTNKILMLGLDNAGKTTILHKLKFNIYTPTLPTIGFNVEQVDYKNIHMLVWDIGGQTTIRRLWKHHFDHTDAIIFVIDASDTERMVDAKEEIDSLMEDEQLKNASLLVFANKLDLANTTIPKIIEELGLHKLDRNWNVQGSIAPTGEGLYEGLEWLSQDIKKKNKKRL